MQNIKAKFAFCCEKFVSLHGFFAIIRMKIVYVIEQLSQVGGMERILVDKMNWLCSQSQTEVVLILLWRDNNPIAYDMDGRIRVVRLNVPRVRGGLLFPLVVLRYNRAVKGLHPDVTVFSWVAGALLATFGVKCGKTIYESHSDSRMVKHHWLQNTLQYRVDAVVALTPEDAARFTAVGNVVVIPNFTLLQPTAEIDYAKKHCIAMGRLVVEKDYPRMIALWSRIAQSYPDWVLDIYGEGSERPKVEQCINRFHLESQVLLHGFTQNVVEAYASGSIFLMTSRTEGFPLVLVEAATCGLPIVAFDCPCGPRNVLDGNSGLLIPYEDDDAYVAAVQQLMSNIALRQKMGEDSKRDIVRFSQESVMQRWLHLFSSDNSAYEQPEERL
ncbi:MAG: glycosyltransferase family 4 protein [Prevotella sp.]|nr:glycosyltransferase family 4 protein [Prevotella sp.]